MITCNNLVKYYDGTKVLDGLNFQVKEGEIFGLLGPNGAGKTTTIKVILGLTELDSGEVIKNSDIHIGYSPETPYFHPFLSAYEVMLFYAKIQKIPMEDAIKQTVDFLKTVGLESEMHKKVKKFSKGMLQRLAVAQALLGEPELLILDEPSSGLDALGRVEMKKMILKLKREGRTIILNSHILADVESVADRVMIIHKGRLLKTVNLNHDDGSINLEALFTEALGGENS